MVTPVPILAVWLSILSVSALGVNAIKASEESYRLVITYKTTEGNNVLQSDPRLQGMRIVKQYGRRLVLDLGRPFDLSVERLFFMQNFESVERVDHDLLIGLQQMDISKLIIEDTLDVTPLGADLNASSPNAGQVNLENITIPPIEFSPPTTGIANDLVSAQTQSRPMWNLADSEPYSIHAENIWKTTNSTPNVVVAVIDSGLAEAATDTFLHLAPGYDFISDDWLSLDEDGRDPDPTDPGDWGEDCPISSWHGTRVASILAAKHEGQITRGLKGVAQNATILPIRVLGLCRMGYASDVSDAIVWAAGGRIDGIGMNPTPAKIISMSFAGAAACPDYLQSAITQAAELGSVLVAAAGNENREASRYFPGNCKFVTAVAASTREGRLATYSNWGPPVALAAPGGDSANAIMTLGVNPSGTGLEILFGMGTSFAAPHVSGVLALLMTLHPEQIRINATTLRLSMSQLVNVFNPDGMCYNSSKCGLGIADAHVGWQNRQKVGASYYENWDPLYAPDDNYYCTKYYTFVEYFTVFYRCIEQTPCEACPVGQYRDLCMDTNSGRCSACFTFCSYGYITHPCDNGFTDNGYCEICPAGTYHDLLADICKKCPPGTYNTMEGLYSYLDQLEGICLPCPTGTTGGEGATSCNQCLPGFFPLNTQPLTCGACTAGMYSSSSGSSQCLMCPAGTFSNAGASVCSQCPAGKFSPTQGSQQCTPCPKGSYNQQPSLSQCSPCDAGTYSGQEGSTTCASCDANYFSLQGASQCTLCQTLTCGNYQYKLPCTPTSDESCNTCSTPANSGVTDATNPACPWICNSGFYRSGDTCVACTTTSTGCSIGQYRAPCADGETEDGKCLACTNGPANSVYTDVSSTGLTSQCPYRCESPNILDPSTGFCCKECGAGKYNPSCSQSSSGSCQSCSN